MGHQRDEFDALGVPFSERGGRTDEAIDLLRAVLRPGPVEHHGSWFELPPAYLHPAPTQPVPILVGGPSARAHRRAATRGDGYISFPLPAEELGRLAARLRELRAEVLVPLRRPSAHQGAGENTGTWKSPPGWGSIRARIRWPIRS